MIDGQQIEHVDEVKYLGVAIDSELTWKKHVAKMISKQRIGTIRRLRKHLSIKTTNNMYKTSVRLGFNYCDIVYDSMSKTLATG